MIKHTKVTLEYMLYSLRQRLLDARSKNDQASLRELEVTFNMFTQIAYEAQDKALASILEELECSARDSLTGVGWKSNIPSLDAIKSALLA
jgi:hypothetical protein